MQKTFVIRRARPDDSQGILDCLRLAFEPYEKSYTAPAFADTVLAPETLQRRFSEMKILVAVDEVNHVIGTIAYKISNGEGHIRGMAVRPGHQGCGVAVALLELAESELRESHCRSITLGTTKPLGRAMRFYLRSGFRPTGEIASFFGMELIGHRKDL